MIAHSLAYVLYTFCWLLEQVLTIYLGSEPLDNLMWILLTILGTVSFYLFFLIVWHLGTKQKQFEFDLDYQRTGSEDFSIDEDGLGLMI